MYELSHCGPEGAILVDPGSGASEEMLFDGIRRAGVCMEDIHHILLTHCHVDHSLGVYRLLNRDRILFSSIRTAEIIQAGGHQVWYEYPDYVIPTHVDRVVKDGEILDLCGLKIQALYTPGHTDGCASYLVETKEGLVALTGDLLCDNGQPGWSGSEGFSVEASMSSLQKLIEQSPRYAFWGHGVIQRPALDWLREGLSLGRSSCWSLSTELHPDGRPPAHLKKKR